MPPKVMLPNQPKEQWADVHDTLLNTLHTYGPRNDEERNAESADYKKWLEKNNSIPSIMAELEKLPQKVKDTPAYQNLKDSLTLCRTAFDGIPATVEDIDRSEKWPQFKENFPKLFGYGEGEKSLSEQLEAFNEATDYKYLSNNAIKTTSYLCRRLEDARVKLEETAVKGANAEVDQRATNIRDTQVFETQLKAVRDTYEAACKAYDTANEGYELDEDEPAQDCRTDEGLRARMEYLVGEDEKGGVLQDAKNSLTSVEKNIVDATKQINEKTAEIAKLDEAIAKQGIEVEKVENTYNYNVSRYIEKRTALYEEIGGKGLFSEEKFVEAYKETLSRYAKAEKDSLDQYKAIDAKVKQLEGKTPEQIAKEQAAEEKNPRDALMTKLKAQIARANLPINKLKSAAEEIPQQIEKFKQDKQRLAQAFSRSEVLGFSRSIFLNGDIGPIADAYVPVDKFQVWLNTPTKEGTYSAADIKKLATADGRKQVMKGKDEGLKALADKLNKFVALYDETFPAGLLDKATFWSEKACDAAARTMVEDFLKANPNGGDFGKEMSNPANAVLSAYSKKVEAPVVAAAKKISSDPKDNVLLLKNLVNSRRSAVDRQILALEDQLKATNQEIADKEQEKNGWQKELDDLKGIPRKDEPKTELEKAKEERVKALNDLDRVRKEQEEFKAHSNAAVASSKDEKEISKQLDEAKAKLEMFKENKVKLQDEIDSAKEMKKNNENLIGSCKNMIASYEKEQASLKKVAACKSEYDKKISGLQSAYDAYKSETKGLLRPIDDTRLENSLSGMQKLFDRHDKNQGSHGNSKEYDAVVAALAVASERINYGRNGDVKADINKNLTALEDAVDKYLEAKGSRTWGSNLRHTRMQYMDDIKAYCKTMRESCGVDVKNLSEEQVKWDNKVLKESAPAMCVAVAKGMDITEMSIEVGEVNAAAYNVEINGDVPVEEENEFQLTGI